MSSDVSTTMRARRVVFDDYTKGFYVESRVEALQRQIETRSKLTNVLNRSQDCKLDYSKGKVDADRGICSRKSNREMDIHRGSLRDYVAHKHVLDKLASINRRKGMSSALGRYGTGCAKVEIQPLIDKHVKETTPSANRVRAAKKLVRKRKKVEVWDRTLNTPQLLESGKNNVKNSRQNTKIRERKSPQLVLPTLSQVKRQSSTEHDINVSSSLVQTLVELQTSDLSLPSVFVTQTHDEM